MKTTICLATFFIFISQLSFAVDRCSDLEKQSKAIGVEISTKEKEIEEKSRSIAQNQKKMHEIDEACQKKSTGCDLNLKSMIGGMMPEILGKQQKAQKDLFQLQKNALTIRADLGSCKGRRIF